jgi:hypothetical protein
MLLMTLPLFWKPFEKALLVFSLLAAILGFSRVESIASASASVPANTELRIGSATAFKGAYSYRKAIRNTKKDTFSCFFSQKTVKLMQVRHQATSHVAVTQVATLCPENRILTFFQRKNIPSQADENSALLS